jgi:hypothetical protein
LLFAVAVEFAFDVFNVPLNGANGYLHFLCYFSVGEFLRYPLGALNFSRAQPTYARLLLAHLILFIPFG